MAFIGFIAIGIAIGSELGRKQGEHDGLIHTKAVLDSIKGEIVYRKFEYLASFNKEERKNETVMAADATFNGCIEIINRHRRLLE